jgi:hypothetical protein
MFGASEAIADHRRQEMLATAAREQLAKEAQPNQLLALPAQEVERNAARVARSTAHGILAALAVQLGGREIMRREQTMLPSAGRDARRLTRAPA